MRTWLKCLALLGVVFPLLFGACGGVPSDPLLRFAGVDACNPNKVFASYKGIPLRTPPGAVESSIFVKSERAGCLGIFWEGQTGDPPYFPIIIKEDGSYIAYDPNTKQPVVGDNKLGATVSPGVSEVDVVVCITKAETAKVADIDCKNLVKGKTSGCLNNPDGLYAWEGGKIPMDVSKGNGTCKLCHNEVCDGLDNNCNGQVDENGACGQILGMDCKALNGTDISKAPTCSSKEACQCLRLSNGDYYVCTGKTTGAVVWTKVETAAATCTKTVSESLDPNVNKSFCGSGTLICDLCEGNYYWRNTSGNCNTGLLKKP